eukprot:1179959-Prorocentrum_minimum.AAC.5
MSLLGTVLGKQLPRSQRWLDNDEKSAMGSKRARGLQQRSTQGGVSTRAVAKVAKGLHRVPENPKNRWARVRIFCTLFIFTYWIKSIVR